MFNDYLNLYQNNDYHKLVSFYNGDEQDIRVVELIGLSSIKIQNFKLANTIFTQLVKTTPNAANYYHLGLSLLNLNSFNEAAKAFSKTFHDSNFEIPAKLNYAHCLIKTNHIEKAELLLTEITDQRPIIPQSWFMLLELNSKNQDLDKLLKNLDKSKKYIGNTSIWKKFKAKFLYYSNCLEETINFIKLNNSENDEDLNNILAKAYININEFEKAIKIFLKLKNENSDVAMNWYNLAAAYSHLTANTDLEKSLEANDNCLKLDGNYHQAYYCKTLVYEKLSQFHKAIQNITYAINIKPNDLSYQYKYAELLNLINKSAESLKILDKIIKQNSDYNLAIRLKGIIQLQQGKIEKSQVTLSVAIEKDNTDQRAVAYYTVSKLFQYKNDNNTNFAQRHFVKEYTLDPIPEYNNLTSFNKEFESDIKNHSLIRKDPNGLAARNGFLTDNLFKDRTRSINVFKKLLEEKIQQYIDSLPNDTEHIMLRHKTNHYNINSWATWIKGDGYIDKHIHEESWISGAYYCSVPEIINETSGNEGYLEYGCIPNDINNNINIEGEFIKPTLGKLVIFPSYLYHQTIPHETKEDRISVAFDLTPLSWQQ